jgi:hypothetical protein
MPPKKQMVPKNLSKSNVLNLNDKVDILDSLKCDMSLTEVRQFFGKKHEPSIHSKALNSKHPEHIGC